MKIKNKLLLLLGVVVLVLLLTTVAMYGRTSSVTTGLADEEAKNSVSYMTGIIDFYFTGLENIILNAIPGVQSLFRPDGSFDGKQIAGMMVKLQTTNKSQNVNDVYVGFERDGGIIGGVEWNPPEGYDSRTRVWYREAVAAQKAVITEPYIDEDTKNLVITAAAPIYADDGRIFGVIALDVSLETLAAQIRKATVLGGGYGILLAPDGLVLEHPDKSFMTVENLTRTSAKVQDDLAAIGKKMVAHESGFGDYTLLGTSRRIYYSQGQSGYVAALVFPREQLSRIVHSVTMIQAAAGGVALVLLVVYMILMIPGITKPLKAVQETLERLASLDLTQDPETERAVSGLGVNTELGAMVASLHNMKDVFTDIVVSVRDEVRQLTSSSGNLDRLSLGATDEVSHSKSAATNVEQLAGEVLRSVEATTIAVQEVTSAANTTAASATEGAESSGATSRLSAEVSEMVNGFVDELRGVGDASLENSRRMSDVGASVAAIGEFATSIRNIATQTNLLALNAAIEAARAGDSGRGFAVVADEVRKLAEESNVASRRVSEMIEQLENGTKNAIASTQESANVVSRIIEKAHETQQSLKNANSEIDKVNGAVQAIAASAQKQSASGNEIAESSRQAMKLIDNLAREISAVTRATEGTQNAIGKVAIEAANLSSISSGIESIMGQFTL
ncbi:MAG: methyl-accepting chemotaxis protein [Synergistaceae bacterium]|jgi:methyl-accepting chemotaxis protein|nr:methyl-accepting chemotaxis protein [Synergistaceae bacterium]